MSEKRPDTRQNHSHEHISAASTVAEVSGSSSGLDILEDRDHDARERTHHVANNSPDEKHKDNGDEESIASSENLAAPGRVRQWFSPQGKLRPFRLLRQDIRNIRSRYVSDWTLFNQLIFASAVYVFFTNILPGITFASDLYVLTGGTWGTIEVVFSTGLCGLVFSLFSSQPLTILGVTGPFAVLAETIYKLCQESFHVDFLPLMSWSLIHAGWMHILLAIFNAHDYTMHYVTNFSADIFSLLNSVIYFHKAIQELQRTHDSVSFASFLYSIIGCIGTFLLAVVLSTANSWRPLFHRYIRMGLAEYAAAISIILFIGMPNIGELATLDKQKLHVSTSFTPSDPSRSRFFVEFWKLPIPWIFGAMIPGAIITVLFFFDHEISSIICTLPRYGTRKPGGFAWDIVLLGLTTAVCGILGIPPANGLLPQAPLHSESLLHTEVEEVDSQTSPFGEIGAGEKIEKEMSSTMRTKKVQRVHEQRWSALLQASGILLFISPPFQHVLGLTPTSVLAGLFLFMGEQSLAVNPILFRFLCMLTPSEELPQLPEGMRWRDGGSDGNEGSTWNSRGRWERWWVGWAGVHAFTILQVLMTGVIFYVTLTPASPAFPVIIIALVPIRLLVMNRLWDRETLRFVDAWACKEGTPEDDDDRRRVRDEMVGDDSDEADEGRGVVEGREMVMGSGRGILGEQLV